MSLFWLCMMNCQFYVQSIFAFCRPFDQKLRNDSYFVLLITNQLCLKMIVTALSTAPSNNFPFCFSSDL